MKPFIRYIKSLWFPVIIVSILSLLTVAGTLYIPTLTATIINDGVDIRDVSRESLHNTVGHGTARYLDFYRHYHRARNTPRTHQTRWSL